MVKSFPGEDKTIDNNPEIRSKSKNISKSDLEKLLHLFSKVKASSTRLEEIVKNSPVDSQSTVSNSR